MIMRMVLCITLTILSFAPAVAQDTLTNESVIKMVQAGLGESIIVGTIKSQPSQFDLSVDSLIALKQAEVPESVISAMVATASAPAAAPPLAPTRQLGNTVAAAFNKPPVPEIGVYYQADGEWVEVPPEVVNWKTGGVLKSVATVGIVKGDVNGRIFTPHSRTKLTLPVEFLIYTPEGVAITEYQLIDFREKKKAREFRTITGGVLHPSGGAQRDLMPFTSKKTAPRTYIINLSSLAAGEYGFLPPGLQGAQSASAQLGKMYTFSIME